MCDQFEASKKMLPNSKCSKYLMLNVKFKLRVIDVKTVSGSCTRVVIKGQYVMTKNCNNVGKTYVIVKESSGYNRS